MFVITKEWLDSNYGSIDFQIEQAKLWLLAYGKDVPDDKYDVWKYYKHLAEYQPNTPFIVDHVLRMMEEKKDFGTELQAHRYINKLRVPLSASYEDALSMVKPHSILELGVGGDSAISTAVFLAYVEDVGGYLVSIDINPLGKTWDRYNQYRKVSSTLYDDRSMWTFIQRDSLQILSDCVDRGIKMDMVFIDTSHKYPDTLAELQFASKVTNHMLLDDATFEGNIDDLQKGGVKRSIEEWLNIRKDWEPQFLWNGAVCLLNKI